MPKTIIEQRGNFFRDKDFINIHSLYSERSDFLKFFPTALMYSEHMNQLDITHTLAELYIEKERVRGTLAEVISIEYFIDTNGNKVRYTTKTILSQENDSWKIIKDHRDAEHLN